MHLVSILIAARNEENNILNCLQAIDRLTYPASGLEVLIGNDASQDQTEALVQEFIQDKPHFRLITISHRLGNAQGKANVLGQLAAEAKGEYLFITDADVEVPLHWIETLLQACQPDKGIVCGTTLVKDTRIFDKLQSLDWLFAQGLIHLALQVNIPVTSLGNNMMVTRKAYQATGGYENMPFSVTEDFLLFHEVMKRKFGFTQIVQAKAMAFTVPAANLEDLLLQRKRWMKGAFQLPLYLVIILLLQAFMLPVLIFLFFFFPSLAVGIFLFKIIVQFAICLWMISKLKYFRLVPYLFLFEPYYSLFSLLSLLYYLWPGKILWKERQY